MTSRARRRYADLTRRRERVAYRAGQGCGCLLLLVLAAVLVANVVLALHTLLG